MVNQTVLQRVQVIDREHPHFPRPRPGACISGEEEMKEQDKDEFEQAIKAQTSASEPNTESTTTQEGVTAGETAPLYFPAVEERIDAALERGAEYFPTAIAPSHDAECETELTSHGYTPCRCDERAQTFGSSNQAANNHSLSTRRSAAQKTKIEP